MTNTTCNRCGERVEWRTTNNGRLVTEYTDADALRYMSTGELPATF